MPRKGISYEQVAKACTDLEKSQRLSVRAIQARTGGSMTTVLKHYRRWQRERSGQGGVETTISDRLRHALLSELEEAAAQSRQVVQHELLEAQHQIDRAKKEAETTQQRLTQQLQLAQQQKRLLERKILDAEQRAAVAERQLHSTQARFNTTKKSLQEEQRKRRSNEAALRQIQDLKLASRNQTRVQKQKTQALEEPPLDSPEPQKAAATKKRGKKVQQSLFDF